MYWIIGIAVYVVTGILLVVVVNNRSGFVEKVRWYDVRDWVYLAIIVLTMPFLFPYILIAKGLFKQEKLSEELVSVPSEYEFMLDLETDMNEGF